MPPSTQLGRDRNTEKTTRSRIRYRRLAEWFERELPGTYRHAAKVVDAEIEAERGPLPGEP